LRHSHDSTGRRANPLAAMIQSNGTKTIKKTTPITCLFLDIGGVLLTDGWDHHARKRAATNFKLNLAEMEDRHHLTFDTYEEGKLTLEEYLGRVVFYQNAHRIQKFKLDNFVDAFVSSSFVHVRKPDADIFRLALDIAHARAHQVVYIENTPMFVRIAEGLEIRSVLHTDYRSACAKLASFGLPNDEGTRETI